MFTETARPSVRRTSPLLRLAARLSSPLPVDAFVQLVDPLWSSTGVRGRVEAVERETPRAVTLVIRPGAGWLGHEAGQWVGLGVDVDGVRHRRCYSLTSVPDRPDGCFTVTVQAIPDGVVSNHLQTVEPGTIVHLDQPAGDFTLPADPVGPFLFVTGGSGLTPVMGMLRTLDAADRRPDVVLVHHAPTEDEALFTAELDELAPRWPGLRVERVITGPGVPAPEHQVSAATLSARCPDWTEREAWACGPAPLLDGAEAAFADAGRPGRLHVERFRPATPTVAPGAGGRVRYARSDRETVVDGRTTLLDAAEAIGLVPASGCRMGICHTCTVPLRSGAVCDTRDGRLTDEPGTHVQLCVSAAAGDVELDA